MSLSPAVDLTPVSALPAGGIPPIGLRLLAFAQQQLQQAQAQLARQGDERHSGIHEARKCIRRTRATLALGARAFDERAQRLDDELARLCRGLSLLRDAQALSEALQRLDDKTTPALGAILPQAEALARQRRDRLLERALLRDPEFGRRRARLQAAQARLTRLDWRVLDERDVAKAVDRSHRRVDKAGERVLRYGNDDEIWHVYRRRLRRLRQQDTLLTDLLPGYSPAGKGRHDLAQVLGESQDDVLLLSHCGRRSPFPLEHRHLLRGVASERLRRTRFS